MTNDLATALDRTIQLVRQDIFPTLDEQVVLEALTGTRVRLRADVKNLATGAGQTALVTAFVVAAQLGAHIVLDIPEVRIKSCQPPLKGPHLRRGLFELAADLIQPASPDGPADLVVLFGDSPRAGDHASIELRVGGDNWSSRLSQFGAGGSPWAGELPFGGTLAGVAAGAEVFRYAMLALSKRTWTDPLPEHRLGAPLGFSVGLHPVPVHGLDLGSVDVVGAGALSTAMLYLLLRIPGLRGRLRVIDDDRVALDNLNRYLLLSRRVVGTAKVKALAAFSTDLLSIDPLQIRLGEERWKEVNPLAGRTVVGVDDIPSRWFVQRHAGGWVGVAATSHFEVLVSEHQVGAPCAGCLHPYDDPALPAPIPTISFVSGLAGLLLGYRVLRAAAAPAPSATLAYPLNLAAPLGVHDLVLAPHAQCPVRCASSSAARAAN